LGCRPENTLFSSSVCVDEINHHHNSLNRKLADFWGECFYMGGLGGLPFVGKTGFNAYAQHVPKEGNLFILFAPHVGLSPDGQIGKYARQG
jgi:Limiting CO2-inducible proteins B/C beta carbonyic anhydrases